MRKTQDVVHLDEMRFRCIVGILPEERVEAQPVEIVVGLGLDLSRCGLTGNLELGVDYASVELWLRTLAQQGEFWLIESMAEAACRGLLLDPAPGESRAAIQSVQLTIRKPEILGGRAVPGVTVVREAPVVVSEESLPGARCEVLLRTDKDGSWRVHLEPEAGWLLPPGVGGCVVTGSVDQAGTTLAVGEVVPRGGGDLRAGPEGACVWLSGDPSPTGAAGGYRT